MATAAAASGDNGRSPLAGAAAGDEGPAKPQQLDPKLVVLQLARTAGWKQVSQVLDRFPDAADAVDDNGATLLHWFALRNDPVGCSKLLELDGQACSVVDARTSNLQTACMWACTSGASSCIRLLAQHGADLNLGDSLGATPLILAIQHYRLLTSALLIDLGCNTEARDCRGCSAAHWAAYKDFSGGLRLLLKAGADLELVDGDGMRPIHRAARTAAVNAMGLLISAARVDPDAAIAPAPADGAAAPAVAAGAEAPPTAPLGPGRLARLTALEMINQGLDENPTVPALRKMKGMLQNATIVRRAARGEASSPLLAAILKARNGCTSMLPCFNIRNWPYRVGLPGFVAVSWTMCALSLWFTLWPEAEVADGALCRATALGAAAMILTWFNTLNSNPGVVEVRQELCSPSLAGVSADPDSVEEVDATRGFVPTPIELKTPYVWADLISELQGEPVPPVQPLCREHRASAGRKRTGATRGAEDGEGEDEDEEGHEEVSLLPVESGAAMLQSPLPAAAMTTGFPSGRAAVIEAALVRGRGMYPPEGMDVLFCESCAGLKPLRSKHDSVTDLCIDRFDHFCAWVGNAVGRGNHQNFLGFTVSACYACCCYLVLVVLTWNAVGVAWSGIESPLQFALVGIAYWWGLGMALFGSAFTAAMTVSHVGLAAANLTTNESVNMGRYFHFWTLGVDEKGRWVKDFVNPFDRGSRLANLGEFFGCLRPRRVTRIGIRERQRLALPAVARSAAEAMVAQIQATAAKGDNFWPLLVPLLNPQSVAAQAMRRSPRFAEFAGIVQAKQVDRLTAQLVQPGAEAMARAMLPALPQLPTRKELARRDHGATCRSCHDHAHGVPVPDGATAPSAGDQEPAEPQQVEVAAGEGAMGRAGQTVLGMVRSLMAMEAEEAEPGDVQDAQAAGVLTQTRADRPLPLPPGMAP